MRGTNKTPLSQPRVVRLFAESGRLVLDHQAKTKVRDLMHSLDDFVQREQLGVYPSSEAVLKELFHLLNLRSRDAILSGVRLNQEAQ